MKEIRKIAVAVAAAACLVVTTAPRVEAHHRPDVYCSSSGDICQSVKRENGRRIFRIALAGRYFDEYTLCLVTPLDYEVCKSFETARLNNGSFGDRVVARRHFPIARRGRYTVTWHLEDTPPSRRVGERLGFHR